MVNDLIVVECKAVIEMHPIYQAQIISYMDLAEKPKGLLINFHVRKLTNGISHFVNNIFKQLPDE